MQRMTWIVVMAATATLGGACSSPKPDSPAALSPPAAPTPAAVVSGFPLEGFPPQRAAQVRDYQQQLGAAQTPPSGRVETVVRLSKRWANGSTLRVAFRGGSLPLHKGIERVAAVWTQYANIGLDFGFDSGRNRYRSWSPGDVQPAAEIRIGFDDAGYWSCVGTDSMVDQCAAPSQQSMNLSGFDRVLPENWISVVLHEFGHALGLEHEHQNPKDGCDADFVWDPEPGYLETRDMLGQYGPDAAGHSPGVFLLLKGPPNRWDRQKTEQNMKMLPNSSAYKAGTVDKDSIMKYEFPEWLFNRRRASKCFSERNDTLSSADRAGIADAYPRELALIRSSTLRQIDAVREVQAMLKPSGMADSALRAQLSTLEAVIK